LLRIALCDNNRAHIEALEKHITEYRKSNSTDLAYEIFTNATELLARISAGVFFDLIFLDTIMPVVNGIDAAKEIYQDNKVTQFVFLSASSEYALESYDVNALDYILKPINTQKFNRAMKRFAEKHKELQMESIIISDSKRLVNVPNHLLKYVEVYDHYLIYHITGSDTIRTRQTMSEIENKLLKLPNFIKTHRSFIVNMDYISKMEAGFITLDDGSRINIAKEKYKSIYNMYLEYKLEKGAINL